jgi:hypothetical protein
MKTKQILISMFYGGLIGAFLCAILIIRSPHAHATPDSDAQEVCELVVANPTMHGVDSAFYMLYAKGYSTTQQATILYGAIKVYCPQEMPVVQQWASSPTINGSTPEGGIA